MLREEPPTALSCGPHYVLPFSSGEARRKMWPANGGSGVLAYFIFLRIFQIERNSTMRLLNFDTTPIDLLFIHSGVVTATIVKPKC